MNTGGPGPGEAFLLPSGSGSLTQKEALVRMYNQRVQIAPGAGLMNQRKGESGA